MQVDPEDRLIDTPHRNTVPMLPLGLLAVALVAGAVWYLTPTPGPENEAAEAVTRAAEPSIKQVAATATAPDIPQAVPAPEGIITQQADTADAEGTPLTLEASDPAVRETLTPVLAATAFSPMLESENLLQRSAALIDAASNGVVLREVLPLPPVSGKFSVIEVNGKLYTDPQSYQRYDRVAKAVAALDPTKLTRAFHQFRPLLEQAYASLGFTPEAMDNALITALDRVIAAPLPTEPAVLVAATNRYVYEDPALENLSPLAGQLLRMGPENMAIVQQKARELRAALLATDQAR